MPKYTFEIEQTSTAFGIVTAKDLTTAKKKIKKEKWDDIVDTWGEHYGEAKNIEELHEEDDDTE